MSTRPVVLRPFVTIPFVAILSTFILMNTIGTEAEGAPVGQKQVALLCDDAGQVGPTAVVQDARVRGAAQKGLDFLAADTVRWQSSNQCYGCHVQAVTLQAMAVGKHHQYEVKNQELIEVVRGITELPGGSRTGPQGLRYAHGTYLSASRSLGGAAFGAYDAWVDNKVRDDLVQTAELLYGMRDTTGAIQSDYANAPVAIGQLQDTVLAMRTWNQAYARSADDRWLTAVAGAEGWLRTTTKSWSEAPPSDIQQINYALMGFDAAGTGSTEPVFASLVKALVQRQNTDGGWALAQGGVSDAYATGQTLYALRLAGLSDVDPVVSKGTSWLITNQGADGAWSHRGSQRAEGMWAVLGLVSVDVLSLSVDGIADGERLETARTIHAKAFDNQGVKVSKVEFFVDDTGIGGACGPNGEVTLDVASWAPGPHLVDVKATNAKGQVARRRFEVFSGPVFLSRVATRWDDGGTIVTLRNLAEKRAGKVRLEVHQIDGSGRAGAQVWGTEIASVAGPQSFFWTGTDDKGKAVPHVRYMAVLTWKDTEGRVVQTEQMPFVHADPRAQAANYANVGGRLALGGEEADLANQEVELVDGDGAVVARTRSTANGQYLFKNIDEGKYKVRVKKEGFAAQEMAVDAKAAEPAPPSPEGAGGGAAATPAAKPVQADFVVK